MLDILLELEEPIRERIILISDTEIHWRFEKAGRILIYERLFGNWCCLEETNLDYTTASHVRYCKLGELQERLFTLEQLHERMPV